MAAVETYPRSKSSGLGEGGQAPVPAQIKSLWTDLVLLCTSLFFGSPRTRFARSPQICTRGGRHQLAGY